ncbi:MAG: hypothetical protein GY953_10700 [bacterium]|nr:hypothetical protein [bacterium]
MFNRSLERSETSYHIPQSFKLTWIYELPFGRGKRWDANNGWNHLIGGWTFSAIQEYRSGSPISIGQSGIRRPAGIGAIRPDVTGASQTLGGAPTDLDFFNGTSFLDPNGFAESPRTGLGVPTRVGTAPRFLPGVRGPHVSSERFRMTKTFPIWESMEFEFGFVAINPFNRHGRGFVTTNVSSGDFGQLRINGGGQRVIQLEGRIQF